MRSSLLFAEARQLWAIAPRTTHLLPEVALVRALHMA